MSETDSEFYLKAGLLFVAGTALFLFFKRHDKGPRRINPITGQQHWAPSMRLATGAAGGGLLLYGMKTSGKMSKLATTAGAGLLSRSLADQPIDSWKDVVPSGALLPFGN